MTSNRFEKTGQFQNEATLSAAGAKGSRAAQEHSAGLSRAGAACVPALESVKFQSLSAQKDSLAEVVDSRGRTFCHLRAHAVLEQGLDHRAVAAVAADSRGRRILRLGKSVCSFSAYGILPPGESRSAFAMRLLGEIFGHEPQPGPERRLRLPGLVLSVFFCRLPGDVLARNPLDERDWLLASDRELAGLMDSCPEMFDRLLILALRPGLGGREARP